MESWSFRLNTESSKERFVSCNSWGESVKQRYVAHFSLLTRWFMSECITIRVLRLPMQVIFLELKRLI